MGILRLGRGAGQAAGRAGGSQHGAREEAGERCTMGLQTGGRQVPGPPPGSRITDFEVQETLLQGSRTAHWDAQASGSGVPGRLWGF